MNNQTRYQTLHSSHTTAYEEFSRWAQPRAYAHIGNALTILRKRNQGKATEDQLIPDGYEWAAPEARGHKITGYSADSIQLTYVTGPWNERVTKTFEMPIADLSLSTWAYNKRVREALRDARSKKNEDIQRAYAEKIAQASREVREARERLEALRSDRDRFKTRLTRAATKTATPAA